MRAEIGIIVPSRGRPQRFAEMVESWEEFGEGRSRIVGILDIDDETVEDYPRPKDHTLIYEVVERASFAYKLRDATNRWLSQFTAIASWNDDHVARTRWETPQLEALEEMGTGIVYGNDLVRFDYLPTAPTISSDLIEALGWICPPDFRHMYIDDFWKALGTELGRYRYLPDVVIEHAHADVGRSEQDETYAISRANLLPDQVEWKRYMAEDFTGDVKRVKEHLGCLA